MLAQVLRTLVFLTFQSKSKGKKNVKYKFIICILGQLDQATMEVVSQVAQFSNIEGKNNIFQNLFSSFQLIKDK